MHKERRKKDETEKKKRAKEKKWEGKGTRSLKGAFLGPKDPELDPSAETPPK